MARKRKRTKRPRTTPTPRREPSRAERLSARIPALRDLVYVPVDGLVVREPQTIGGDRSVKTVAIARRRAAARLVRHIRIGRVVSIGVVDDDSCGTAKMVHVGDWVVYDAGYRVPGFTHVEGALLLEEDEEHVEFRRVLGVYKKR